MKTNMRNEIFAMIAGIMVIVVSGCSSDESLQDFRTSTPFSLESVYANIFTDYNKSVTRSLEVPYNAELLRSGKLSVSAISIAGVTNVNQCNVCYDYDVNKARWVIDQGHASSQGKADIKLTENEVEIIAFYPHQYVLGGDYKDYIDRTNTNASLRTKPRIKMYARLYNNYNLATRVGRFRADIDNPVRVQTLSHIYSLLSLRFVKQETHLEGEGVVNQITIKNQPVLKSKVSSDKDFMDNNRTAVYHLAEDRIELRAERSDNVFTGLFKSGEQAHILLVPQNVSEEEGIKLQLVVDGKTYNASIPASYFQNELRRGFQYRFKVYIGESWVYVSPDDSAPVINGWDDSPEEIQPPGEIVSKPVF